MESLRSLLNEGRQTHAALLLRGCHPGRNTVILFIFDTPMIPCRPRAPLDGAANVPGENGGKGS